MVLMSPRAFAQTFGEVMYHQQLDLSEETRRILRMLVLRFRDEYIQEDGFSEGDFYMMCDPNNVLNLTKKEY